MKDQFIKLKDKYNRFVTINLQSIAKIDHSEKGGCDVYLMGIEKSLCVYLDSDNEATLMSVINPTK